MPTDDARRHDYHGTLLEMHREADRRGMSFMEAMDQACCAWLGNAAVESIPQPQPDSRKSVAPCKFPDGFNDFVSSRPTFTVFDAVDHFSSRYSVVSHWLRLAEKAGIIRRTGAMRHGTNGGRPILIFTRAA